MLEGKALIEDTDMPVKMQLHAMASASQALDVYDVFDCKSIAAHIKKVLPFPSLNTPRNDFILLFLVYFGAECFMFMEFGRSLTKDMGEGGNVWWDQISVVSLHILRGHSFIFNWRPSSFSSSKVLLLLLPPVIDAKSICL